MSAAYQDLSRALRELQELIGSWTGDPALSRVLCAQIRAAESSAARGDIDEARGGLNGVMAGIKAAGPASWNANLSEAIG